MVHKTFFSLIFYTLTAATLLLLLLFEQKVQAKVNDPQSQLILHDNISNSGTNVMPIAFHAEPNSLFFNKTFNLQSSSTPLPKLQIYNNNASLRMTFDVLNPGLDFNLTLTSDTYPLLQDQYGSMWKVKDHMRVSIIKSESKFTYKTNNVPFKLYKSKSESLTYIAGVMQNDQECLQTFPCCAHNATHYKKYKLIDSPVPPYMCTSAQIQYSLPNFTFATHVDFELSDIAESNYCFYEISSRYPRGNNNCESKEFKFFRTSSIFYNTFVPSSAYSLCFANGNFTSAPIPVTITSFCTTRQCIGYTEQNYFADRGTCNDLQLGVYTSLDQNNTNQFNYFEKGIANNWMSTFDTCRWINDMTFAPAQETKTLQAIGLLCDINIPSTNWQFAFDSFQHAITDYFVPTFPFGKIVRIGAQFIINANSKQENNNAPNAAVSVQVEYIYLSEADNATWTMKVCQGLQNTNTKTNCVEQICNTPALPLHYYPQVLELIVPLQNNTAITTKDNVQSVIVSVYCPNTPESSPFRFLLPETTLSIQPASKRLSNITLNTSLARIPEHVRPPYKDTNSRLICIGDYKLVLSQNNKDDQSQCVPYTDAECKRKYGIWKSVFDSTAQQCISNLAENTTPLQYISLPRPTRNNSIITKSTRESLTEIQVPRFMKPMKDIIAEYDAKRETKLQAINKENIIENVISTVSNDYNKTVQVSPEELWELAAKSKEATLKEEEEEKQIYSRSSELTSREWITIVLSALTVIMWILIFLRDCIQHAFKWGPWQPAGQPTFDEHVKNKLLHVKRTIIHLFTSHNKQSNTQPNANNNANKSQNKKSTSTKTHDDANLYMHGVIDRGRGWREGIIPPFSLRTASNSNNNNVRREEQEITQSKTNQTQQPQQHQRNRNRNRNRRRHIKTRDNQVHSISSRIEIITDTESR